MTELGPEKTVTESCCTRDGCNNPRTPRGRCAECLAAYQRQWQRRPENRAKAAAAARAKYAADPQRQLDRVRNWEQRNPERYLLIHAAGLYVKWALLMGIMERPEACEWCPHIGYIEAAHADYLAPFDVIWLCKSCHRQWDREEPKSNAHQSA